MDDRAFADLQRILLSIYSESNIPRRSQLCGRLRRFSTLHLFSLPQNSHQMLCLLFSQENIFISPLQPRTLGGSACILPWACRDGLLPYCPLKEHCLSFQTTVASTLRSHSWEKPTGSDPFWCPQLHSWVTHGIYAPDIWVTDKVSHIVFSQIDSKVLAAIDGTTYSGTRHCHIGEQIEMLRELISKTFGNSQVKGTYLV